MQSSIQLIVSPVAGHVSPQFHITFDGFVETFKQGTLNIKYGWQLKPGLVPQQKSVTFHALEEERRVASQ